MKRIILIPVFALLAGTIVLAQEMAELNIQYEGDKLSEKNIEKIEQMAGHMTDFYSTFGLGERIDVSLMIFRKKDEGYAYMRSIYPDSKSYQRTTSDEYFKTGLAGVYMPARQTAVVLGLEQGIERGLSVIFHEISHHFTRLMFGKRTPPIWLNEGLAEHFEYMKFSRKKGWTSDVSDFDKGKLRTMYMLGELTVEDLFDLTHKDFKQKLRNEGDMFYAFSHVAVVVLMENLDKETFSKLISRLISRKTDQKTSMIVSELYPGGLDEYKKAIYEFIH